MQSQPLVSFCLTTYKRRDYLQSTLDSIARQTCGNFEVVVSDNDPEGSARETVEGRGDSRFKYFPNGINLGMKKSFNQSLNRSSGQYIVMIADDDPVYPEMLDTLLRLAGQYPGYGVYLGGSNWFCTDPRVAHLYKLKVGMNSFLADEPVGTVKAYSPSEFLLNFFNRRIFSSYLWSTAIVKREILIKNGGTPDYGTPFLGDYAYLSVMAADSGCVVINEALGHQTVHLQNFGRDQNEQIKTAATNFPAFVAERISHLEERAAIGQEMNRFVALWVVAHISFLHQYNRIFPSTTKEEMRKLEKDVFSVPLMRPYYLKYWLKVNIPWLHNLIVVLKSKLIKK